MTSLYLATAGDNIKLWDCNGYSFIKQFNPHNQNIISALSWEIDNNWLVSTSAASNLAAFSVTKSNSVVTTRIPCENETGLNCVALSGASRYLLTGSTDTNLYVYDIKCKKVIRTYKEHSASVSCAVFNSKDTHISSGSDAGEIIIHSIVTAQVSSPLVRPGTQAIRQLQYSPHERALLASVSDDGVLNLWDTNTRRLVRSISDAHVAPASGLVFSPVNDVFVISVGLDKRIASYDTSSKKVLSSFNADSPLTSVDMHPDGIHLAVGTTKGKVHLYDLRQPTQPYISLRAHKTSVHVIKFQTLQTSNHQSVPKSKADIVSSPVHSSRRQLPSAPLIDTDNQDISVLTAKESNVNITVRNSSADVLSPLREGFDSVHDGDSSIGNSVQSDTNSGLYDGVISPLAENRSSQKFHDSNSNLYTISPLATGMRINTSSVIKWNTHTGPSPTTQNIITSKSLGSAVIEASPILMHPNKTLREDSPSVTTDSEQRLNNNTVRDSNTDLYVNLEEKFLSSSTSPEPALASAGEPTPRHYGQFVDGLNNSLPNGFMPTIGGVPLNSNCNKGVDSSTTEMPMFVDKFPVSSPGLNINSSSLPVHEQYQPVPLVSSGPLFSMSDAVPPSASRPISSAAPSATRPTPVSGSDSAPQSAVSFQRQLISSVVQESLEDFREQVHWDMLRFQVEMLRQFQRQMGEMQTMFQQYSLNEDLVAEVERLREENERLRKTF